MPSTKVTVDDGSESTSHVFKKPAPRTPPRAKRKRVADELNKRNAKASKRKVSSELDEEDELAMKLEEDLLNDISNDDEANFGEEEDEAVAADEEEEQGERRNTTAPINVSQSPLEALVSVTNIVFMSRLYHTDDEEKKVQLNVSFLLRQLARYGFRENPKKFKSIIVKVQSPSCSVILFEEGKVVCPGTRNADDARLAIDSVLGYVRRTRGAYSKLKCRQLRIQNIVGLVGYPNFIDVRRLLQHEPDASHNPLSNGVTLSVRIAHLLRYHGAPSEQIDAAEKRNTKVAVLVYQSGRVVITGGKKRDTLAMALSYAMKRVRPYFIGRAERIFSHEDIRRHCSTLRAAVRAYEGTDTQIDRRITLKRKLSEFFVVRQDGTIGTMLEWYAQYKPHQVLHTLLTKIGEPYTVPEKYAPANLEHARVQLESLPAPPSPTSIFSSTSLAVNPSTSGSALVKTSKPHESALVVARNEQQMAVLNERGSMRTSVVRAIRGRKRAEDALAKQEKANLVVEYGAKAVREATKPKIIKVIPSYVAADLFSGIE